jgi:hypothetical protein
VVAHQQHLELVVGPQDLHHTSQGSLCLTLITAASSDSDHGWLCLTLSIRRMAAGRRTPTRDDRLLSPTQAADTGCRHRLCHRLKLHEFRIIGSAGCVTGCWCDIRLLSHVTTGCSRLPLIGRGVIGPCNDTRAGD